MLDRIHSLVTYPVRLWRRLPAWSERSAGRNLQDFLPPSLEVLEKPPHPAPRVLLWVTASVFAVGLVWAVIGKVDIITGAEGKIIPGGKVKVIQPLEKGVVTRILVSDGQLVKAGEPLVELDQTQNSADRRRVAAELDFVSHKLVRREIIAQWLAEGDSFRVTPEEARDAAQGKERAVDPRLLYEEWHAQVADVDTLKSQLEERRAELKTSKVLIQQYAATIPLLQIRVDAVKHLYEQKVMTKMDYLTLEEERQRQLHGQEAEVARAEQLSAAIVSVERQISALNSKALSDNLSQIDDLTRQKLSLTEELAKLSDASDKMLLSSPVAGTVKGLAITTIGGVVSPAEVLMEVVPLDERLEVEAFVGNQDIGYVREGQTAEVKIHTFPFTRYGIITAKVESVARDATVDEKLGLIYRTRLSLTENTLLVDGTVTPLLPGMAVTAEIATGQRRLIEFFLSPLMRAKQESLRER